MAKVKQVRQAKKVPVGVQIISVIYYIGAIVCALLGILMIAASGYLSTKLLDYSITLSGGFFIFAGVIFIILGILGFFIGMGLWKLKRWARITAIILAILGVISGIYSIIKGFMFREIISIAIHAVMGGYLLFSKNVEKAFK